MWLSGSGKDDKDEGYLMIDQDEDESWWLMMSPDDGWWILMSDIDDDDDDDDDDIDDDDDDDDDDDVSWWQSCIAYDSSLMMCLFNDVVPTIQPVLHVRWNYPPASCGWGGRDPRDSGHERPRNGPLADDPIEIAFQWANPGCLGFGQSKLPTYSVFFPSREGGDPYWKPTSIVESRHIIVTWFVSHCCLGLTEKGVRKSMKTLSPPLSTQYPSLCCDFDEGKQHIESFREIIKNAKQKPEHTSTVAWLFYHVHPENLT